jgi:hypothetical protein
MSSLKYFADTLSAMKAGCQTAVPVCSVKRAASFGLKAVGIHSALSRKRAGNLMQNGHTFEKSGLYKMKQHYVSLRA